MICALCNLEKNPKSNTHYLTDFIIRTALNEEGVNVRSKGLYFNFDQENLFSEMRFQRETSPQKLEEILGRPATDEEIQIAIDDIEFSVNDKFCKDCEDIFGVIENNFHDNILNHFRNQEYSNELNLNTFNVDESKIVRLFFLLQFWRTSICDDSFSLSDDISEFLRLKILNMDYEGLETVPLSVTYLETLPEVDDANIEADSYKTGNIVSPVSGSNPYIILLNDFVIQLYDDYTFPYIYFYGLNTRESYLRFLNFNSLEFESLVFLDSERKEFLSNLIQPTVLNKIAGCRDFFRLHFQNKFGELPSEEIEGDFLDRFSKDENINKLSEESLTKFTKDFLGKL